MYRAFLIIAVVLTFFVPFAQAEKKEVNQIICSVGTLDILLASKEATFLAVEQKGLYTDTGVTHQCVGVIRIIAGKRKGNGFCKDVNQKGDIAIMKWTAGAKSGEGTWKWLYGTGMYEGIKGEGKYKRIAPSKPIAKGTYQSCNRVTGTTELPK